MLTLLKHYWARGCDRVSRRPGTRRHADRGSCTASASSRLGCLMDEIAYQLDETHPTARRLRAELATDRRRLRLDRGVLAVRRRRPSPLERTAEHPAGHQGTQRPPVLVTIDGRSSTTFLHVPLPRRGELNGRGLTTAALADRLPRRLEELDAEAVVITRALAALDGNSYRRMRRHESQGGAADVHQLRHAIVPIHNGRTAKPPTVRRLTPGCSRRLGDSMSSRASMLALTSGLSAESVRRSLESLERCGRVRRDRIGLATGGQLTAGARGAAMWRPLVPGVLP